MRAGIGGQEGSVRPRRSRHLERALSLWDRVPDAEALAGRPGSRSSSLLGAGSRARRVTTRAGTRYTRRAVDMLEPDTDPLRGEPGLLRSGLLRLLHTGTRSVRRRRSDARSSTPATLRPRSGRGLSPRRPSCTARNDRYAAALDAAERAIDAAGAAELHPKP